METVAEYVDGLPNLCGQETLISEAIETGRQRPVFPGGVDIERVVSGFAVALHMHQPIISGSGWGETEPQPERAQYREEPQGGRAGPSDDERGGGGSGERQEHLGRLGDHHHRQAV
jgi:hypothetical protein